MARYYGMNTVTKGGIYELLAGIGIFCFLFVAFIALMFFLLLLLAGIVS